MLERAKQELISALRQRGFLATPYHDRIEFSGAIDVQEIDVPIILRFDGANFLKAPKVMLPDTSHLGRYVIPHLSEDGELCVFDRQQYLYDPYRAAESCLGILEKARNDLERNKGSRALEAVSNELPQHFGSKSVYTQFGRYEGWLDRSNEPSSEYVLLQIGDQKKDAFAINSDVKFSFTEDQKRPSNVRDLFEWLDYWDPLISPKVMRYLSNCSTNCTEPRCIINTANGQIGFTLRANGYSPKQNSINSQIPWKKRSKLALSQNWKIERLQGTRADFAHALRRNGGNIGPISDKKVALIGCGAIGSFLAHALAQNGAGAGAGKLFLIDHDRLSGMNIVRHLLGQPSVGAFKSKACAEMLQKNFPELNVAYSIDEVGVTEAEPNSLQDFDVIIDATGEQHVSEWINLVRLSGKPIEELPDVFHCWIEGHGAAVRSFQNRAPQFACFRCLSTDLETTKGRYWVLNDNANRDTVQPCGEAPYTPYGPSAPMAAAALNARHVAEWCLTGATSGLITQQLDYTNTRIVKPASPSRIDACPACSRATV